MVFTLNICIYKDWTVKIKEKRKRRHYVLMSLKTGNCEWIQLQLSPKLYSKQVNNDSVPHLPFTAAVGSFCTWNVTYSRRISVKNNVTCRQYVEMEVTLHCKVL